MQKNETAKTSKLQRIFVRRSNDESRDFEAKASVQISQTVSFAALKSETAPVYNATWEFDAEHFERCPVKGDVIVDADKVEWHVQKVVGVTHRKVRQCQAYAEMTVFLPFDSVTIVRPCAARSPNGSRMTTVWRRVQSNVPAKIATEDMATHRKNMAKTAEKNLRAYVREHLSLQKNDLVELPDGRQYKIVRVRNSRPMLGWSELFLAINDRPVAIVDDGPTS